MGFVKWWEEYIFKVFFWGFINCEWLKFVSWICVGDCILEMVMYIKLEMYLWE